MPVTIRPATEADVPLVLAFIRDLAAYERLAHECVATEDRLRATLFGPRPYAEAVIAEVEDAGGTRTPAGFASRSPVGFALFFHTYSTFLARPGLYLEDLFVRPDARGAGVGRALLAHLAALAVARGCGRLEWSVLDWNADAIRFYERIGARPRDGWTVYRLDGAALGALGALGAGGAALERA